MSFIKKEVLGLQGDCTLSRTVLACGGREGG